jgi:hypothetical protein
MMIEKMKVLGLVVVLAGSMACAGSKNGEDVKNAVKKFFGVREYAELVDEENDDVYFLGRADLFVYPTLSFGRSYGHYVFEKEYSSLDDIRLDGEMDYRSFVGSPYTILKAGKSMVLRKAEGKYFSYNFKENLSAK